MKTVLVGMACSLAIMLGGCARQTEYRNMDGKVYGTYYHISYQSDRDLDAELRACMQQVNTSLSMFDPISVVSRINRNESDSVDTLFVKMYRMARKVYEVTDGAFDITVAPLANAWGFGFKEEVFPDSLRIDSLRRWVGMDKLRLEGMRLQKKYPQMEIDASSIAKGLGVDLVADCLDSRQVENYMVEIGGEIRVRGKSARQRPWRVGIDRPEDDMTAQQRQLQMILEVTSGGLATSGNYRNFYIHEGKKYAHTLNPRTGYPVQTEILSSSVYAPSCMEADAYATAFMVMGLEGAKKVVAAQPQLEACFVYQEDGKLKTWVSEGVEKMMADRKTED